MKRTPAKRSSLFLLELIIAILFFSLTSAVCVQFFARAHQIQPSDTGTECRSGKGIRLYGDFSERRGLYGYLW